MKRYWVIVSWLLTFTLIGCSWKKDIDLKNIYRSNIIIKTQKPSIEVEKVTKLPKIRMFNWLVSIEPLVESMLNVQNIAIGSLLLIDSVKNSVNGKLYSIYATEALNKKLSSNKKFVLISENQLEKAKKNLGLSENDSLNSLTKAIGLARSIGAQYVLYSNIKGNVKSPIISIQLMIVKTGEIIWSGEGVISY